MYDNPLKKAPYCIIKKIKPFLLWKTIGYFSFVKYSYFFTTKKADF